MRRRVLLLLGACAGAASAQSDWQRVAVPYVAPGAYLSALYAGWYAPRAKAFEAAARALTEAQRLHCRQGALAGARAAWIGAMTAWESLNAVAIGPLVQRRSARRVDFSPARPASVERAVREGVSEMARVGGPAKGLPALEWLLWKHTLVAGSAACEYAVRVAEDIADEAASLAAEFSAPREWSDEAQAAAFAEVLNQFVGGVEALRWAQIERPLKEGRGRFARAASGATARAWAARWQALRTLAIYEPGAADAPVSIEAYLRGRGLNPLADRLRGSVQRSALALHAASPARPPSLAGAGRALGSMKRLLEGEVAPALEVSIGFTDSDGD